MAVVKFKESWSFQCSIVLVATFLVTLSMASDTRTCIRLSQCNELSWLKNNLHSHPVLSSGQIAEILISARCGFDAGETKVMCHVQEASMIRNSVMYVGGYTDFRSRSARSMCTLKIYSISRSTNELRQPVTVRNRYM